MLKGRGMKRRSSEIGMDDTPGRIDDATKAWPGLALDLLLEEGKRRSKEKKDSSGSEGPSGWRSSSEALSGNSGSLRRRRLGDRFSGDQRPPAVRGSHRHSGILRSTSWRGDGDIGLPPHQECLENLEKVHPIEPGGPLQLSLFADRGHAVAVKGGGTFEVRPEGPLPLLRDPEGP